MAPPLLVGPTAIIEDEDWNGTVLMNRLGGTVKLGDIHDECATDELDANRIVDLFEKLPRSERVIFGSTVYGATPAGKKKLDRLPLEIKRELKNRGRSARWVTSEGDQPLTPAAVAKLKLTSDGYDLLFLVSGGVVSIGLTTHVQDADFWSERDYGRPVRDDENGMLPPKLARMMVNLGALPESGTLLDPFCGSGTVLMEAALATHAGQIIMSDIEMAQVNATKMNLDWLIERRILRDDDREHTMLFASDARDIKKHVTKNVDAIVTEGYLGPPLSGHEPVAKLMKNAEEITQLWRDSLIAFKDILAKNGRIVGVWPSMKSEHGSARVDLTDELNDLGYRLVNPLAPWDTSNDPLLYHRVGQRVMRRIVVLERLA
ncbi:MAG: hypothetical protein WC787_04250 [Patescibacteria group bacterium]|jgi:tRNA G10  N-methylase Trm11